MVAVKKDIFSTANQSDSVLSVHTHRWELGKMSHSPYIIPYSFLTCLWCGVPISLILLPQSQLPLFPHPVIEHNEKRRSRTLTSLQEIMRAPSMWRKHETHQDNPPAYFLLHFSGNMQTAETKEAFIYPMTLGTHVHRPVLRFNISNLNSLFINVFWKSSRG